MALFSKSPARKPGVHRQDAHARAGAAPAANARAAEAEDRHADHGSGAPPGRPAGGGITITGFGLVEPSPTRRVIEVTHGTSGLCAVLENAVLLFASGHAEPARALLAEGIETDTETRDSPLAWLALFDLLQRARDRDGFERLALSYVVQFERSAPAWDDRAPPATGPRQAPGGHVSISGRLTASSAAQLEPLRNAIAGNASQARFDLATISEFDDAGARLLADVLGEARRKQYPLRLQRADNLRHALAEAVARGRDGGEGAWLLSLELLQWHSDRATFDDLAVEYAVTFEVSPPSWEPSAMAPAGDARDAGAAAVAADLSETLVEAQIAGNEVLGWTGVVAGAHPEQVAKLTAFADGREVVPVDMRLVERIDFVGAGAVYNAIQAIEDRRKSVQIFGATPLIRAMLLLIGVAPGYFFKKAG
jgi:ABC-type transporter Mla MlaB component